ncbi:MAG TPA: AMP-binding protein, partial [Armatimonadota bacterium]
MEKALRAGNLAELYREAAERFGERPAFATRGAHKRYETASFTELYEQGLAVATALIHRGLGAREHVAIFSDNRFEWIVTDCALQTCGAASVPRGRDVTDAEILYILPHAEVRVAFVEDAALAERVQSLRGSLPGLELIVVLDPCAEPSDSYLRLADLVVEGRALRSSGDRLAEARVASIRPDDLFTLIYTSGTTGIPKGVMLTHQSMISQVRLVPIRVTPRDRAIAILPIWHILERVYEMILIAGGACAYYSSIRTLKEDFAEVRPTLMVSAPRLWESVYQGILAHVK